MRRIELLITQSRRATENVEFTDETGISDEEFLQYANDAQDKLQSLIQSTFPNVFQDEAVIPVVSGQEEYEIPDDCLYGSRIELVEFSRTSQNKDYFALKSASKKERLNILTGTPSYYIRRSKVILPQPVPNESGLFRFTYQKQLPRLDKRRGVVSAVTLGVNTITSLTLDTTEMIDADPMTDQAVITVIDKNGIIHMRRIDITAVDTDTGVVTIDPSFTFDDGETIEVGDYVVAGRESTTNSELPDLCERYLIAYMNWKIFKRDSSNDAIEQSDELSLMETDIVDSFKEADGDIQGIPITDTQYFTFEE